MYSEWGDMRREKCDMGIQVLRSVDRPAVQMATAEMCSEQGGSGQVLLATLSISWGRVSEWPVFSCYTSVSSFVVLSVTCSIDVL